MPYTTTIQFPVNLTNRTYGTATGSNFTAFDFSATTNGTATGDAFTGYDFAARTNGTATGDGFSPYNFMSDSQPLVVTVDGGSVQTITLTGVCSTLTTCAGTLSS